MGKRPPGYLPIATNNLEFVTNTTGRGGWLLLDTTNERSRVCGLQYRRGRRHDKFALFQRNYFHVVFPGLKSDTNSGGTGPGSWGRLLEAGTPTPRTPQ